MELLLKNYGFKKISEIEWVSNLFTKEQTLSNEKDDNTTIQAINEYICKIDDILRKNIWDKTMTLAELEEYLKKWFWTDLHYLDWKIDWNKLRLANCFAWPETHMYRDANNIILPNWETPMPTKTNIWARVVDPIGWMSKWPAPSGWYNNWNPEWYGIMGKILELRPASDKFNKKVYMELMNTRISFIQTWIAVESWKDEIAVMPTFKMTWWEDIISKFSEERKENDIQTAKHYLVNQ